MSDKEQMGGRRKKLANVNVKQGTSDEKQVPAHADEGLKVWLFTEIYYTVYNVCHRYNPLFISHVMTNNTCTFSSSLNGVFDNESVLLICEHTFLL